MNIKFPFLVFWIVRVIVGQTKKEMFGLFEGRREYILLTLFDLKCFENIERVMGGFLLTKYLSVCTYCSPYIQVLLAGRILMQVDISYRQRSSYGS